MEECLKVPPEFGNAGGWVLSLAEEDDDGGAEAEIKEELVEKVMQELRKEISSCYSDRCYRKAMLPSPPGYVSASAPFVVVGGDDERCGPAVSGEAATMMVGVGLVGPNVVVSGGGGGGGEMGFGEVAGNGSWVVEGGDFMQGGGGGEKMDGCDGGEVEDEWLTRVLSWGPQELEDFDQFDLS